MFGQTKQKSKKKLEKRNKTRLDKPGSVGLQTHPEGNHCCKKTISVHKWSWTLFWQMLQNIQPLYHYLYRAVREAISCAPGSGSKNPIHFSHRECDSQCFSVARSSDQHDTLLVKSSGQKINICVRKYLVLWQVEGISFVHKNLQVEVNYSSQRNIQSPSLKFKITEKIFFKSQELFTFMTLPHESQTSN